MGIHDREYYRTGAGRNASGGTTRSGVAQSIGMWSVNTWIIVLCVAVFVLDGFLPATWVSMGREVQTDKNVDWSRVALGDYVTAQDGRVRVAIDETGEPVGRVIERRMPALEGLLHFSTARVLEVWRLIGFQFLHDHSGGGLPVHLMFNMIGLYFFGPLVERYLGSKRYLAFYLLCGVFGALMYGILNLAGFAAGNLRIPGLLFNDPYTPLVGASAGVFGVLMAGAFMAPNARVLLFFFLPMRLQTLAYVLIAMALFSLFFGADNAGGEAAHLGGAIAGFYFIRNPHHLHSFFDVLGRADPTSHHYRRGGFRAAPDRSEVDRILDKVHREGIQSLTAKEKRILQDVSRR